MTGIADELEPTDATQFASYRAKRIPDPGVVRGGVVSVAIPYRAGVPYAYCYLIADEAGRVHVIDPGSDTDENRVILDRALRTLGASTETVASVTATHLHQDHSGLADWLATRSGVPVAMHRADIDDLVSGSAEARYSDDTSAMAERWTVPAAERHRLPLTIPVRPVGHPQSVAVLVDGDLLPVDGRRIEVVHTPGHTRGHVCLVLPDDGLILTGDHVFPRANPGIARGGYRVGDDPVAEYLDSLERLHPYDGFEVAPGHGYRFRGLALRRRQIREHVLTRAREVERALAHHPGDDVWSIASELTWMGGSLDLLEGNSLQSALVQTECYVTYVEGARGRLALGA
ncbi:MBL fold metallo-hydrolase [Cnuibacter physcomitrellae]|uniref:MBL fold metallo-hydrolase n=1 Tax=Cnuibacter physcomitrellae TaxID=1619308 RepID=UPI0021760450|nr:MBL fold metallo-hydrolase [Cnuibacter physcomitrellae]MCS5498309.1 MBL fold metallo-hydrolase [Cnuibacter physcomitrellae]